MYKLIGVNLDYIFSYSTEQSDIGKALQICGLCALFMLAITTIGVMNYFGSKELKRIQVKLDKNPLEAVSPRPDESTQISSDK